jgi:hypothetical protein
MSSIPDLDPLEPTPDEILAETFPAGDPIGMTFASGMHESDLLSFLERAKRLSGEVC